MADSPHSSCLTSGDSIKLGLAVEASVRVVRRVARVIDLVGLNEAMIGPNLPRHRLGVVLLGGRETWRYGRHPNRSPAQLLVGHGKTNALSTPPE